MKIELKKSSSNGGPTKQEAIHKLAKMLAGSHAFDLKVGNSYSLKLCNQKIGIIQLGHLATHKKGHPEGPALSMVYPAIHKEGTHSIHLLIKTCLS